MTGSATAVPRRPRSLNPWMGVDLGAGARAVFTTAPDNMSPGLAADEAQAATCRDALATRLGAPVRFLRQVHGATVHVLGDGDDVRGEPPEADAVVTTRSDVALAVLVADCVPVLLADPRAGVVAAVHAGRRGLVAGVVPATVQALTALGADPGRVRAVVGPAVCGECYEVPAGLREEVAAHLPTTASRTSWGTPALDLPAGVHAQLTAAGVRSVAQVDACTLTDVRWFSHRGARPGERPPGRFAGAVRLLPR